MKKRLALLPILAAIIALVVGLWPGLYLVVTGPEGRLRYFIRTEPGARFTVRFTHSVALRPVDEVYTVRPEGIQVTETIYDMNGAGLPSCPWEGQTFTVQNDTFRITGFTTVLSALTYRVARVVADHQFIMGKTLHHLSEWGAPGSPLTFSVRRATFLGCLAGSL